MKVIVLLLGVGAVLLLFAGGCGGQFTSWYTDSHGVVHTHCWSGCSSGTSDASGMGVPDSPILEDALAIHAAAISTNGDEANIGVFRLVDRASKAQGRSRDALVQQKLPRLAARITAVMPTVRDRLLALDLQTTAGANCRMAVLRMLARTESLYSAVSDELATNQAPARVVHEVTTGENAMARAFTSDLKPCLVGLQPESRAAVKYVLGG